MNLGYVTDTSSIVCSSALPRVKILCQMSSFPGAFLFYSLATLHLILLILIVPTVLHPEASHWRKLKLDLNSPWFASGLKGPEPGEGGGEGFGPFFRQCLKHFWGKRCISTVVDPFRIATVIRLGLNKNVWAHGQYFFSPTMGSKLVAQSRSLSRRKKKSFNLVRSQSADANPLFKGGASLKAGQMVKLFYPILFELFCQGCHLQDKSQGGLSAHFQFGNADWYIPKERSKGKRKVKNWKRAFAKVVTQKLILDDKLACHQKTTFFSFLSFYFFFLPPVQHMSFTIWEISVY